MGELLMITDEVVHNVRDQAVVRASLDGALEDLLCAAVEVGPEPYEVSCARIDAAFDRRMVPHQQLGWATDAAAMLKRTLKQGLRQYRSKNEGSKTQGS